MLVEEIMTKEVITIAQGASLREAADLLFSHHISGLPVVDDYGSVVGIITEADLLCKEVTPKPPAEYCLLGAVIYLGDLDEYKDAFRKFAAVTVDELMTKKVVTVGPEDEVGEAARLMLEEKLKTLPVVKFGRIVGIVSCHDILKLLL